MISCMQGKKGMRKEFRKYPKYYENYIRAFDKMLKVLDEKGLDTTWINGEEVMHWWISDISEIQGQTLFEGFDLLDI